MNMWIASSKIGIGIVGFILKEKLNREFIKRYSIFDLLKIERTLFQMYPLTDWKKIPFNLHRSKETFEDTER